MLLYCLQIHLRVCITVNAHSDIFPRKESVVADVSVLEGATLFQPTLGYYFLPCFQPPRVFVRFQYRMSFYRDHGFPFPSSDVPGPESPLARPVVN